jgi:hypothetical protein
VAIGTVNVGTTRAVIAVAIEATIAGAIEATITGAIEATPVAAAPGPGTR